MATSPSASADRTAVDLESKASRSWIRSPQLMRLFWCLNLAALSGIAVWIIVDGQFSEIANYIIRRAYQAFEGTYASGPGAFARRVTFLLVAVIVAAATLIGILLGLFFGATSHRRVRSWFAFTLLVAAWLTFGVSWRELAWQAQVLRLSGQPRGLAAIAQSLASDWPAVDGERPGMGPFMAYPIGQPTMIMMLAPPNLPGLNSTFSSVERGADGVLRFELTGDEPGAWVEWHPNGSRPGSFSGGLELQYVLHRSAPIGDGWFVARYFSLPLVRN